MLPRRVVTGDLVMEDGLIVQIAPRAEAGADDEVVDCRGQLVLPGLIDASVRFRAYTRKGDESLATGTMAAVKGGVTSVLEVADAHPEEVHDARTLAAKLALADESCWVDYGFWMRGETASVATALATPGIVGVRLAIDCSSAQGPILERWFADYDGVLAVHAEDRERLASRYAMYESAPDVTLHHRIRDVETAVRGTRRALELAARHGTRVHLLDVSSAEQVELLTDAGLPRVTAAVALARLVFTADDVARLGTRLQCNPPLRAPHHRDALWRALETGDLGMVCSDHCPSSLAAKALPYPSSASGLTGVEWLLPRLYTALQARGDSVLQLARWCAEAPATAFGLHGKGRLEVGFDADVVVVDPEMERTVTDGMTWSAAGWSPYSGQVLRGWPVDVWRHGRAVLRAGELTTRVRGRPLNPRSTR